MQWNEEKDMLFIGEMASLGVCPAQIRKQRERGQVWQQIAADLNGYPNFSGTLRVVRECFTTVMRKDKAKIRKKVQGTGLGG